MKVDTNLPVMILQTKRNCRIFPRILLNKAVNKPLKVSDVYGNLSYNGLNITECLWMDIPRFIKNKDYKNVELGIT